MVTPVSLKSRVNLFASIPLGWLLVVIALAIVMAILVLFNYQDPTIFGLLLLVILAGIVCYRPVAGLFLVLGGSLALEQYAIDGLDPITYHTPFFININSWTPLSFFTANLIEVLIVLTFLSWFIQGKRRGDLVFRRGRFAWPIILLLTMITIFLAFGLLTGGDWKSSLWEVRPLFYMGACYFLAVNLLKSRQQVRLAIWIVILTIGLKALQGVWRYFVDLGGNLSGIYAITGHEDALFFDSIFILLAAFLIFGGPIRQKAALFVLATPMLFTFLATQRRASMIALPIGLAAVLFFLPRERLAVLPKLFVPFFLLLLIYVPIFYNSEAAIAKPIQSVKSLYAPNPRDFSSNLYRDIEKYDVAQTIHQHPFTGIGFGQKYLVPAPLPVIYFPLWNYIPHNEMLWLWVKTGTIGFLIFWFAIGVMLIKSFAIVRNLQSNYYKAITVTVVALLVMQMVIAEVDLQLTFYRNMIYLGFMLGLVAALPWLDQLPGGRGQLAPTTFKPPGSPASLAEPKIILESEPGQ